MNETFLKNVFGTTTIASASLDYGRRNEGNAKAKYLQKFSGRHFHECGLLINNAFPFLAATPDGKICHNGKTGIIEIKCPYAARQMTITDACERVKDFCLSKENDLIRLKEHHSYYAQVQGQLMISGVQFCEFIVFTQRDLYVERVIPDIAFMQMLILKLATFFQVHGFPFVQGRRQKTVEAQAMRHDHMYTKF